MKRTLVVLCLIAFVTATTGCTMTLHENKQKYWAMQNNVTQLPCIDVIADQGYISYPLLLERKGLFAGVTDNGNSSPIDIKVKLGYAQGQNVGVALLWLVVSGSSAFIVPYKSETIRTAEFSVIINGKTARTFRYEDRKKTWISIFGPLGSSERNDEYFVEELIADQFVNSFIIDLEKDHELISRIRRGV